MGLGPFFRGFDRLFDDGEPRGYAPAVDITEEEDHFLIKADLPGVDEKDIEVKVHDGVLLLSGKREETREEEEGYSYRERRSGSFCRQFRLGRNVDAEKIEAAYKKGVLEVKLPKKEEAKPRQIAVSSN
jgi:HSP20 family protein